MNGYAPIEVVLDVRTYQDVRRRTAGGNGGTDFFAGADAAFEKHRNALATALRSASATLARNPAEFGYVKVKMHTDAHAKSHRPTSALFPSRATPVVGLEDGGELIVQATASQLLASAEKVMSAEINVRTVEKADKDGELQEVPVPSPRRVEASAVASVSVWSAADKRSFSAKQATVWAQDRKLALRYRIDLFDYVEPDDERTAKATATAGSYDSFFKNLGQALGGGYFALLHKKGRVTRLYLWLMKDMSVKSISRWQGRSNRVFDDVDLDVHRHEAVLSFLDQSYMVRRIGLPGAFLRSASVATSRINERHVFSKPLSDASYPIVGIVDGGLSPVVGPWVSRSVVAVPRHHTSEDHGTEIASLLVDGQQLNGPLLCAEPDGCFLVDIGILPSDEHFAKYYGDHQDFLHALNDEVRKAKEAVGARVFCFAHNVEQLIPSATYDELSLGLDQIAVTNDVVFVVCAGNLQGKNQRPEWKPAPAAALSDLAAAYNDRITVPGDSLFSVSVGALNPRSCTSHIAEAPARYSRRGPGYKGHVKPDLVHFGGHAAAGPGGSTELRVVTTSGNVIWTAGTSFSAPVVAKTLARIDQLTEGKLSRDALIALCIHGSSNPTPLTAPIFEGVRRDLVGYGLPTAAEGFLSGDPSSATLVFMDVLQLKKDMFFEFEWPTCLTNSGSCHGKAWATLVYTPPIDEGFGAEIVRIDLEVGLHQRNVKTGKYDLRSKNVFKPKGAAKDTEENLIKGSLKWNNVKKVEFHSKQGVGKSSQWQVSLKYLERAEEAFPVVGVPFAIVLSITDPDQVKPVYQDMRASLSTGLVQTTDIHLLAQAQIKS
jgi:hypothetical protein